MTFRLEGFDELEKALSEIGTRSTQIAVTRRAIREAARPMVDLAKSYAPIDEGDLEASISISTRATGEVGNAAYSKSIRDAARAAKAAGQEFDLTAAKGNALKAMRDARRAFKAVNPPAIVYMGPERGKAFYAKFVEFGTGPRTNGGIFKGTTHPGTAAQPFMRPAFDAQAKATIDRIAGTMWVEIEKSARRAARKAQRKAKG